MGFVDSPAYISFERGSSTIGSGSVAAYCLIPEEDFALEAYSDAYLVLEKEELRNLPIPEEYARQVDDKKKAELEALGEEEAQASGRRIRGEAEEKIAEAEQELADAKAEFDREIADGEAELAKARREIDDGRAALRKAEKEYRADRPGRICSGGGENQLDEKKQGADGGPGGMGGAETPGPGGDSGRRDCPCGKPGKLAQSRKELDALVPCWIRAQFPRASARR